MTPRWEDLHEGAGPPPLTLGPLTRTDFVRYQGASGDMNPVHHDEPFARAAGYPAPLAVGMFQAGVLTAWAAAWLGPENLRRTRIRWNHPVFPGDVLTFHATVARTYEEAGERRVELALRCTLQSNATAVTATAEFVVP